MCAYIVHMCVCVCISFYVHCVCVHVCGVFVCMCECECARVISTEMCAHTLQVPCMLLALTFPSLALGNKFGVHKLWSCANHPSGWGNGCKPLVDKIAMLIQTLCLPQELLELWRGLRYKHGNLHSVPKRTNWITNYWVPLSVNAIDANKQTNDYAMQQIPHAHNLHVYFYIYPILYLFIWRLYRYFQTWIT